MHALAATLGFGSMAPCRLQGMRWVGLAALFTAFAVVAPAICHAFGIAGMVFLPLHFAVLLAALVMGVRGGLLTALTAPLISFAVSGMPPISSMPVMLPELTTYAAVAGWMAQRRHSRVLVALICALIAGRLVSLGLSTAGLGSALPLEERLRALFVLSIPGVLLQLLLLPTLASKIGSLLGRNAA